MGQNEYRDKCFLKEAESITAEVVKLPIDVLSGKTG